jgi:hypothetical protein
MKDSFGRDARVQMAIIESHTIDLYHAAINEERSNILSQLRQMIQEKDAQGDLIAVGVLDWAIDRLLRS